MKINAVKQNFQLELMPLEQVADEVEWRVFMLEKLGETVTELENQHSHLIDKTGVIALCFDSECVITREEIDVYNIRFEKRAED